MLKHVLLITSLLLTVGCMPGTDVKKVDRPDETPMVLPEVGWTGSFVGEYTDSEGGEDTLESDSLSCAIKQHEFGAAADYCGFVIWVLSDHFLFTTKPYLSFSFFSGDVQMTIAGQGSAEGSTLSIHGERFSDGFTWDIDYEVVHSGEMVWPESSQSVAASTPRIPKLAMTPNEWVAMRAFLGQ